MNEKDQVYEIDLLQLAKVLWKNAYKIVIYALIAGIIALGVSMYLITPKYSADCMFYVNNSTFSVGSSNFSISSQDITASQSLVDTYIVILNSRSTLNEVIAKAQLDTNVKGLSDMITASAVNGTEVFKVTVTTESPEESKLIANTIAEVLPNKVSGIIEGSSVRIVDYAVKPSVKSSPSITKNTAIGLVIGGFLSAFVIIIRHLFDDVVRTEEFLTSNFDIPMLAIIPNLTAGKDKGYYKKYKKYGYKYYKYGYKKGYGYGYDYGYGYGEKKGDVKDEQ